MNSMVNGTAARQVSCHQVDLGGQTLAWREAGTDRRDAPIILLLHGISSNATSWMKQLQSTELTATYRLLAWDAPGYGASSVLSSGSALNGEPARPTAAEYAEVLNVWLDALGIQRVVVVGHSLGAMMASAFAARYPAKVIGMILADPAQGYATQDAATRERIFIQRQTMITTLGPAGYAAQRAVNLLRAEADESDLEQVRSTMRRLQPAGFLAAAWMLAHDAISHYLPDYQGPLQVWCGDQDRITPPAAAEKLAQDYAAAFRLIPAAGHASYIDAATTFNRYVQQFIALLPISKE